MSLRRFSTQGAAGAALQAATAALLVATGGGLFAFVTRATAPPPSSCLHSSEDLSRAFEHVADALQPSVVSITTANKLELSGPRALSPFPGLQLFRDPGRMPFQAPNAQSYVQWGQGSGLIVSEDGYILTNHHVVKGADEVNVRLWDDSSYVAEIVGADPKTDLAVLKIDGGTFTPARMGDSDRLRVGQWVAALGNPFGLSSTMTAGVVSATGRSRVGVSEYEDFIQTDAAINPGNSGGPLVNLAGEVVGINTAIFSRSGGYMGIGFSIPSNMVRLVMDSLIEDGRVDRGLLGVLIQNLDEGMARSFGYEGTDGALVSHVNAGSPAEEAGIRPGDIILEFDGVAIDDVDRLRFEVAAREPGTEVEVRFLRDGVQQTVQAVIDRLGSESEPVPGRRRSAERLGLETRRMTSDLARRLQLSDSEGGVVVSRVEPLSPASRAGIRVNDVLRSVDGEPVDDPQQLERILADVDLKTGVRVAILREGTQRYLFLRGR